MGEWAVAITAVFGVIFIVLKWLGGKERIKKQQQNDARQKLKDSQKTGDSQDVLDAFDNID
ncbi:hypothetical protein LCGC14_0434280 [marine sediment metagenome]|uniref:Uncharacterized protein n=1 Tax=marine sediment metagenome TaxID=412755 RepID=A0A0F9VWI1_9ZZZZ|nr:hypothetical protein [Pricia sp.]